MKIFKCEHERIGGEGPTETYIIAETLNEAIDTIRATPMGNVMKSVYEVTWANLVLCKKLIDLANRPPQMEHHPNDNPF